MGKITSVKVSTLVTLERLARRVFSTLRRISTFLLPLHSELAKSIWLIRIGLGVCSWQYPAMPSTIWLQRWLSLLYCCICAERRLLFLSTFCWITKGFFRAAPLDSSLFFGNVNEVSAVIMTVRHHSVLQDIAQSPNGVGTRNLRNLKPSLQKSSITVF